MESLFQDNNIVLILADEKNMTGVIEEVAQEFKEAKSVCVFAIGKPAKIVGSELVAGGLPLSKMHFIDAVSKCRNVGSCSIVDSPGALTDLGIAYSNALKVKKCDAALLQGITLLSFYVPYQTLVRFMATLAQKTRLNNAHMVIATIWDENVHAELRDAFLFMDKVIDRRAKA